MKGMIGIALAFALALYAVPAMAGDTFQAFRRLPAGERARLTPLADDQLAATEGEHVATVTLLLAALRENIAKLSGQIVYYTQIKVNTGLTSATQSNVVEVTQRQGSTTSVTTQSR